MIIEKATRQILTTNNCNWELLVEQMKDHSILCQWPCQRPQWSKRLKACDYLEKEVHIDSVYG